MTPPDENTAADPTGTAWVVWVVVAGPGLVYLALACVRRAGRDTLVLVVRRGHVVRCVRSGLVARWPGLERFEQVPTGPRVLPLVVRARTCDGVDVVALADLTLVVREVAVGSAYEPVAEAARRAEETVEGAVERLEVEVLVERLPVLERRWPGQVTRLLPAGTEATALTVTQVEARLTPGGPA